MKRTEVVPGAVVAWKRGKTWSVEEVTIIGVGWDRRSSGLSYRHSDPTTVAVGGTTYEVPRDYYQSPGAKGVLVVKSNGQFRVATLGSLSLDYAAAAAAEAAEKAAKASAYQAQRDQQEAAQAATAALYDRIEALGIPVTRRRWDTAPALDLDAIEALVALAERGQQG